MIRPLIPTPAFVRAVRRVTRRNNAVAAVIQATLTLLEQDAFYPRLGTHKLTGDMAGL